jgi:hypothetical protein
MHWHDFSGAVLPHGITNLGPINKNLDVSYPGVGMSYDCLPRTMFGFTNGMRGSMAATSTGSGSQGWC